MLDIAILIIFIIGFLVGLKRGFILQFIYLTGFIIAFVAAYLYYDELAPKLRLWIPYPAMDQNSTFSMIINGANLDEAFYRAIAFAIIFFAVKIILHLIGSMLDFVAHIPVLKQVNGLMGGILAFLEIYILLFIVLYIAALLPVESIQAALDKSFVAEGIIKHTPIISDKVKDWWIDYVAS